jgi:hypothetical protein
MIGRVFGIIGALILAGWLYWLTARAQLLLDRADATLARADRTLETALAMLAATPAIVPAPAGVVASRGDGMPSTSTPMTPSAPVTVLPPAAGPPTVPAGMVLEAEKRALVERAFSVHGAPRRFTFKTSDDGDA